MQEEDPVFTAKFNAAIKALKEKPLEAEEARTFIAKEVKRILQRRVTEAVAALGVVSIGTAIGIYFKFQAQLNKAEETIAALNQRIAFTDSSLRMTEDGADKVRKSVIQQQTTLNDLKKLEPLQSRELVQALLDLKSQAPTVLDAINAQFHRLDDFETKLGNKLDANSTYNLSTVAKPEEFLTYYNIDGPAQTRLGGQYSTQKWIIKKR